MRARPSDRVPSTGRRSRCHRRDDGGFALVWFALSLVVLLAVSGAGVDVWSWWYAGNQHQRTADAAALGGVVFLPGDGAKARATAMEIAVANGADPSDIIIETRADDGTLAENELRVTMARDVRTNFLRLVGVESTIIRRSAVSEFNSSLQMGSPEQLLGRDPDLGEDPGYWLSVSGSGEHKVGGDRYTARECSGTNFGCDTTPPSQPKNTEWAEDGYFCAVSMSSPPTGDLVIEAWDPVFSETQDQSCLDGTILNSTDFGNHQADIAADLGEAEADVVDRYEPGPTIYCHGDIGSGNLIPTTTNQNVTTFIVREPDDTQSTDSDNAIYEMSSTNMFNLIRAERAALLAGTRTRAEVLDTATCTQQYKEINLDPDGGDDELIYSLLNTGEPTDNDDTNDMGLYAQSTYRRWVPVCRIDQSIANGWYAAGTKDVIVQVLPNAGLGDPFLASGSRNGARGRNHFSLRARYGNDPTVDHDVTIQARGRLPLHNGAVATLTTPAVTEFFVTRVPPGNAGRTLKLDFYDIGDYAPGIAKLDFEIFSDSPAFSGFDDCTFERFEGDGNGNNTGTDVTPTPQSCTLTVFNFERSNYNGRVVEARLQIPLSYTCDLLVPTDCWIKARVTYTGADQEADQVYDHTTWDSDLVGEPVRLVE